MMGWESGGEKRIHAEFWWGSLLRNILLEN
jgi:hypothetical protein